MRLLDHDEPIDPEIAATLDAIDAVLAGEPVDAEYAEMAEVALLLSAEKPQVPPSFAHSMDTRVARRFAPDAAPPGPRQRRWLTRGFWEASGAMVVGLALIVGLVVLVGGQNGSSSMSSGSLSSTAASAAPSTSAPAPSTSAGAASSAAGAASGSQKSTAAQRSTAGAAAPGAASSSVPASSPPNQASSTGAPPLQPPTTGRKVVQSAQLQLSAPPNRIDDVSQQVYNVIGDLDGIVQSSTVTQTGGADGYANFQLSVPSASLGQAMSRLSSLNYATVLSRTDATQDITDEYGAAQRALADARALRTSLLKQLANATTTEQIDSLNAQIHDAEASISSDQATLARLDHEVGFSQLSLSIGARTAPAPVAHSGGFGIGRAAHDAGRVLTVAAGVALIALAALVPVALVAALFWWVGAALRRRRREQALDSA